MNTISPVPFSLNLRARVIDLSTPVVMGILNVTPDSFYDGGKYKNEKEILTQVEKMLLEGALIIDVGGASSRPNAEEIAVREELNRVLPVIRIIVKAFPEANISIDTYRAKVAEEAIFAGAAIINDISGGALDEKMFETVIKLNVPYILMHMVGNPSNMAQNNHYNNLLSDIIDYFARKLEFLTEKGLKDVIIDPGFGFSKNIAQNFQLLKNLSYFNRLNRPVLAGVSRKSMIYKTLGISPEDALNGTSVLNTVALMNGASVLRVHDVKEAVQAIKLLNKLK